jgi:hypothetical protein
MTECFHIYNRREAHGYDQSCGCGAFCLHWIDAFFLLTTFSMLKQASNGDWVLLCP